LRAGDGSDFLADALRRLCLAEGTARMRIDVLPEYLAQWVENTTIVRAPIQHLTAPIMRMSGANIS
jgi:hypothetical protein